MQTNNELTVVIIGAGIGGLVAAITCRQWNIRVIVLERTPKLRPVGAGIQLPANATRVMRQLGLYDKLKQHGAVVVQNHTLRSYSSGKVLAQKHAGNKTVQDFGSEWMVIHRAKYQALLHEEAQRLGADIRLGCEAVSVDTGPESTTVNLSNGNSVTGDVIIGADGLWSQFRQYGIGLDIHPLETGDLAYRGVFTAQQLKDTNDSAVKELLAASDVQVWLGPEKHVVFYPVNDSQEYNLVLLRPDDLPTGAKNMEGSLDEMRTTFEGWDPRLTAMIAQLDTALKWKLCDCRELDTWVKGLNVLLGDACHPTLPYQAQGAAMAVEDGLVIGILLGQLQGCSELNSGPHKREAIHSVLKLYEKLRKSRTTLSTRGAVSMQHFFHLDDGPEQAERDAIMDEYHQTGHWPESCMWNWGDKKYQHALLGFDVAQDAEEQFAAWRTQFKQS